MKILDKKPVLYAKKNQSITETNVKSDDADKKTFHER